MMQTSLTTKTSVTAALVLLAVLQTEGLTFSRCGLARALIQAGMPRAQIADWVCLVEAETTTRTTRAISPNGEYGLFQINGPIWCLRGRHGGGCNMRCESLNDNDIRDDVACAKYIFNSDNAGFTPWVGWTEKCRGRALPDLSRC